MIRDEIEAKIAEVESLPESRLRTLRLMGLRVLLAKHTNGSPT